MKQIIDISEHQGKVNLSRVKASGNNDIIIRVGWIGNRLNHTIDRMFRNYIEQAIYNNMNIGIYVYSYCKTIEAIENGTLWLLEQIKNYKQHIKLPVFLDLEDESISGISREQLTNYGIKFCEIIENNGYTGGIYANKYWFENKLNIEKLTKYKIWLAQYNDKITRPSVNFKVNLWQYTSKGFVDGINTSVDLSYCLDCNVNEEEMTGEIKKEGEFEMKQYSNGSTKEIVYKDTDCTQSVGYLFPYEQAECYGIINGKALIVYNISGTNNKKTGFVKWLGGVK